MTLSAFGARTWIADAFLRDTANALDRQNVTSAPRFFEKAVAWGANADVWYSRRMLQIEQTASAPAVRIAAWQAAVDAAQRAPLRAEDPHNALYNLAAFCSLLNDARCVERNLRAAVAAAPAWYKPHWMLARTLEAAGRVEEAKSEAKLALDLNSGKDSEVKETLQAILAREK